MNYFKYGDETIEKYRIEFDREKMEEFKERVINECSEITHCEYDGTKEPHKSNGIHIRNYTRKEIGFRASDDCFDPNYKMWYHFSYDEYKAPYLVTLIRELLLDDASVIDKIFEPDYSIEGRTLNERIKESSDAIDRMDNTNPDLKIVALQKLQKLYKQAKYNENQKPVQEYYKMLQGMITLELVDTISTETVKQVCDFYDRPGQVDKMIVKKIEGGQHGNN